MNANQKTRVMIATPTYTGELVADYVRSLLAAQLYCAFHKVELELNIADRYSLIQFARNRLTADFLADESYTHILWIDADLGFDPTAIMRLLTHDKDVIGGAYPVKSFPPWFPIEPVGEPDPKTGLQLVSTAPTGFLLCSRRAMQAAVETVPVYTHYHAGQEIECPHLFDLLLVDSRSKPGKKDLIGEDVVLCRRLAELGFEIWIEPDISFKHVGQNWWAANLKQTNDSRKAETPQQQELRAAVTQLMGYNKGPDLPPGTLDPEEAAA